MSKDGGPAFPIYQEDMNVGADAGPGMSLRDYFAAQALAGLYANPDFSSLSSTRAADIAYDAADSMLYVREETTNE